MTEDRSCWRSPRTSSASSRAAGSTGMTLAAAKSKSSGGFGSTTRSNLTRSTGLNRAKSRLSATSRSSTRHGRVLNIEPGTLWLKGKDSGAEITGIRARRPGRAFRSFHMDYKGHRILVRYAEHGVAAYRPECGDECDEHENVEKPTTWYTVTTLFRWLSNLVLPGIRPAPVPAPAPA
jgi:hypothetical protein